MKRVGILMVVMLTVSLSWGQSYKTAIGIKGGWPYYGTIDVKHNFGGAYGEFRVGGYAHDLWFQGLFEKNYAIVDAAGLEWYWGVGGHIGFWNYGPGYHPRYYDGYVGNYNGAYAGVDGVIGIEYTFDAIPLNLAADFGPSVNFYGGGTWIGWGGAFAARIAIK